VSLPLILLGGITSKKVMDQAMAEGFQFVAMGRALLMEPDLVNRIGEDATVTSRCVHCNKCVPTIYSAARCVLVEPTPGNPAPRVIA
jgi:2,4-dienoyl-CoA reductase-like NADH-dependent reductase (Old Yellow Enzyme family)